MVSLTVRWTIRHQNGFVPGMQNQAAETNSHFGRSHFDNGHSNFLADGVSTVIVAGKRCWAVLIVVGSAQAPAPTATQ